MSAPKSAHASPVVDRVVAAFDAAPPLDEPLSPEDIAALEAAMADPRPGISSEELLERLHLKT